MISGVSMSLPRCKFTIKGLPKNIQGGAFNILSGGRFYISLKNTNSILGYDETIKRLNQLNLCVKNTFEVTEGNLEGLDLGFKGDAAFIMALIYLDQGWGETNKNTEFMKLAYFAQKLVPELSKTFQPYCQDLTDILKHRYSMLEEQYNKLQKLGNQLKLGIADISEFNATMKDKSHFQRLKSLLQEITNLYHVIMKQTQLRVEHNNKNVLKANVVAKRIIKLEENNKELFYRTAKKSKTVNLIDLSKQYPQYLYINPSRLIAKYASCNNVEIDHLIIIGLENSQDAELKKQYLTLNNSDFDTLNKDVIKLLKGESLSGALLKQFEEFNSHVKKYKIALDCHINPIAYSENYYLASQQRSPIMSVIDNSDISLEVKIQLIDLFAQQEQEKEDCGGWYVKKYIDITSCSGKGSDHEYRYPLDHAVERADVKIVEILLKHGSNVNRKSAGKTALHRAMQRGDFNIVYLLCEYGANIHALEDKTNKTPLHFATDVSSARYLVMEGADANAKDIYGNTPLHELVSIKFLKHKENTDVENDNYNDGIFACCKYLANLESVDVNETNKVGYAALHLACDVSNENTDKSILCLLTHLRIQFLCNANANVNLQTNDHQFPLTIFLNTLNPKTVEAKEFFSNIIMKVFIQHGLKINVFDGDGNTYLHIAIANNLFEQADVLMQDGAKANIKKSTQHPTPLNTFMLNTNHMNHNVSSLACLTTLFNKGADPYCKYNGKSNITLPNNADVKTLTHYGKQLERYHHLLYPIKICAFIFNRSEPWNTLSKDVKLLILQKIFKKEDAQCVLASSNKLTPKP